MSDDLISRQAAITQLSHNKNKGDDEWELAVENDIQTIWKLPPIQPRREERKIGEWIYDWGDWDFETCKCSECGNYMTTPIGKRYSFCPNCGAKMEVTE